MGPNSRPPLTSRIRASFEGKRSRSSQDGHVDPLGAHPVNGLVAQDTDSLRSAIEAAINSETFQTAIAANLAKLIKPNIKTALDTIQPLVESVYAHELLLRQTNKSVENILERMGDGGGGMSRRTSRAGSEFEVLGARIPEVETENNGGEATPKAEVNKGLGAAKAPEAVATDTPAPLHALEEIKQLLNDNTAKTAATLSDLSSSIASGNAQVASLAQGVEDIHSIVHPTREGIENVRSVSDQSATVMAVMQGQLDQLKDDIGELLAKVSTVNAGAGSSAVSTKDDLEKLSADINDVRSAMDGYGATLASIQNAGPHPDLIAALRQSNDHHTSHAVVLDELKARSLDAPGDAARGPHHTAALEELKADLASIKENVEAGITSNNDHHANLAAKVDTNHDKHAEALSDIKSLSTDSTAVDTSKDSHYETKLADVKASLDSNITTLNDIITVQAAQSEVLASQTTTLAQLKDANESHTAALLDHGTALKASQETDNDPKPGASLDTSALEGKLLDLTSTLDDHTTSLRQIIASGTAYKGSLDDIISVQNRHTTAITEIAEKTGANTDVLNGINAHHDSHVLVLNEIKAAHAAHSTSMDELKDLSTSHVKALGSLQSESSTVASDPALAAQLAAVATVLETHTASFEHLKSLMPSSSALVQIKDDPSDAPLAAIFETLEAHTTILAEIKDDVSAEILTSLHELGQISGHHTTSLNEIREADVSDEILTLLHGSAEKLEEISAGITKLHEWDGTRAMGLLEGKLAELKDNLSEQRDTLFASHELLGKHAAALEVSRDKAPDSGVSVAATDPQLHEKIDNIAAKLDDHHAAHNTSLNELKSSQPEPTDLSTLEERLGVIQSTLDEHHSTLSGIKDNTTASTESHADHTTALNEIQAASLSSVDSLSSLAASLKEIQDTQVVHSTSLAQNQVVHSEAEEPRSESPDFAAIDTHLQTIVSKIEDQSALLADIRAASDNDEILLSLKSLKAGLDESNTKAQDHEALIRDMHAGTSDRHQALLSGIAGLAVGDANASTSAPDSDKVLESLGEVYATVSKTSAIIESMNTQLAINHTTTTTSITTLSDELKAEIDATGTGISDHISILSTEMKNVDTTLQAFRADSLKDGVYLNPQGLEQMEAHAEAGIHLSERGLSQLKMSDLAPSTTTAVHLNDRGVSQVQAQLARLEKSSSDGVYLNAKGLSQLRNHLSADRSPSESTWFGNTKDRAAAAGIISNPAALQSSDSVVLDPIREEDEDESAEGREHLHEVEGDDEKEPEDMEHMNSSEDGADPAPAGSHAFSVAVNEVEDEEREDEEEDREHEVGEAVEQVHVDPSNSDAEEEKEDEESDREHGATEAVKQDHMDSPHSDAEEEQEDEENDQNHKGGEGVKPGYVEPPNSDAQEDEGEDASTKETYDDREAESAHSTPPHPGSPHNWSIVGADEDDPFADATKSPATEPHIDTGKKEK